MDDPKMIPSFLEKYILGEGHQCLDIDLLEEEAKKRSFPPGLLIEAVADLFKIIEISEETSFTFRAYEISSYLPYSKAIIKRLTEREGWRPVFEAHERSFRNKGALENSSICGCFYCLNTFLPNEIKEWVREDETAICPKCGIDSVIGDNPESPITQEFLGKMKLIWFNFFFLSRKAPKKI